MAKTHAADERENCPAAAGQGDRPVPASQGSPTDAIDRPAAWDLPDGSASVTELAGPPADTAESAARNRKVRAITEANRQQPPPRTILRLRFSRGGPATWLAHLDLMRTFERSVKRANLPVQWSAGFNPRPDIVFALPIGVGLETCADYVDLGLMRDADPAEPVAPAESAESAGPVASAGTADPTEPGPVEPGENVNGSSSDDTTLSIDIDPRVARYIRQLRDTLPDGLMILSGRLQPAEKESIMGRIAFADYQIEAEGICRIAEQTLALTELMIDKPSKGKMLRVDIRPLVLQTVLDGEDRLRLRVRAGSRENLRPDLFLQALVQYGGLSERVAADARLVRTGLYLSPGGEGETPTDPEGHPMPPQPAGCV